MLGGKHRDGRERMRGQSSAEMLILMGVVLMVVSLVFYQGAGGNEMATVMSAARTGAENAIAALDSEYGCAIDIEQVGFDAGTVTIYVNVRGGPPPDNQAILDNIRANALKYIYQAVIGSFPESAEPVKTGYYTYDVNVGLRRVTK